MRSKNTIQTILGRKVSLYTSFELEFFTYSLNTSASVINEPSVTFGNFVESAIYALVLYIALKCVRRTISK